MDDMPTPLGPVHVVIIVGDQPLGIKRWSLFSVVGCSNQHRAASECVCQCLSQTALATR
jgi:hypothetical protein